jgi:hypothetical protein
VGDEYGGYVVALAQGEKLLLHLVACDRIEGAERLVEEQEAGVGSESSCYGYALPLAAG